MLAAVRQFRVVRAYNTTAQTLSKISTTRQCRCKKVQPQSASIQFLGRQAVPQWAQQLRSRSFSAVALTEASDLTASRADDVLAPGLYLVGTPIGNLEDLSVRALKILQNATVILAEDTRHSRKLLNHYGIKSHMYSFHQHNEYSKQNKVLEQLSQGASVAVISDAGMPLISDPGSGLVAAAAAAGYPVVPIAGPSAFLLALVASGLSSTRFTFVGFLPDKPKHRQQELQDLADLAHSLVFYVPPHDLLDVLQDAVQILGAERRCVVARELTKVHEQLVRCTLQEAVSVYTQTPAKGEVTLVVDGATNVADEVTAEEVKVQVAALMSSGQSTSSAAKIASKQLGVPRRQAYAAALGVQRDNE